MSTVRRSPICRAMPFTFERRGAVAAPGQVSRFQRARPRPPRNGHPPIDRFDSRDDVLDQRCRRQSGPLLQRGQCSCQGRASGQPSGTANFGSMGVGSSVDQTFTVTNNGATMLHVSASVDAPPDHLARHRRTCCISGSTSHVLPYQAYVEVRSPDSSSCRASRAGGATAAH
jgi:hypothetical protein